MSIELDYKRVGTEFIWFMGVVEDRNDPLQLGRVRVRIFGHHTGDTNELPPDHLPWAQPMQPITSAAISGVGTSPTGLVEGSWVVGFFMDGKDRQRPLVMGSLAGIPDRDSHFQDGFVDPSGVYPKPSRASEPDTPRLARWEAEEDESLMAKRSSRTTDVPISVGTWANSAGPEISKEKDAKGNFTRETWTEPNPRYNGESDYKTNVMPLYPFNHVYRGESGNVIELDETPGNIRTNHYHPSGTFTEVMHLGDKVTKVVANNYTIIVENDKLYIRGFQNITVEGDTNIYSKGSFIHEVDGDYLLTIKGDRITKIVGNDVREVMSDDSTQINGNKNERVSKEKREITDWTYTETVGNNHISTVKQNEQLSIFGNQQQTISANSTQIVLGHGDLGVGLNYNIGANNINTTIINYGTEDYGTSLNLTTGTTYGRTIGTAEAYVIGTTWTGITGDTWLHTTETTIDITGKTKIDLNKDV